MGVVNKRRLCGGGNEVARTDPRYAIVYCFPTIIFVSVIDGNLSSRNWMARFVLPKSCTAPIYSAF